MDYDDDYWPCDEDDGEIDRPYSPPRLQFEPGDPSRIRLGILPDGSPVLRIGRQLGFALDFDGPTLPVPTLYAIAMIKTQRGLHLIFSSSEEAAWDDFEALHPLADQGHIEASRDCGSWDLRICDKETLQPRQLVQLAHGQGSDLFRAIADVWQQGGGVLAPGLGAGEQSSTPAPGPAP